MRSLLKKWFGFGLIILGMVFLTRCQAKAPSKTVVSQPTTVKPTLLQPKVIVTPEPTIAQPAVPSEPGEALLTVTPTIENPATATTIPVVTVVPDVIPTIPTVTPCPVLVQSTATAVPEPTLTQQCPTATPEPTLTQQLPTATSEPTLSPEPPLELLTPMPEEVSVSQKSVKDFLEILLLPVGHTMYVWGGGWNEEDTGAGIEAVTLGLSNVWAEFAAKQDASYNYEETMYQIHNGLDCSGYIGWAVYNLFETENGKEGYVLSAIRMAENFAERGWGEYIPMEEVQNWKPGDVMSMKGHVWVVLGTCEDGSVLLVHASAPGIALCGTKLESGGKSQAVRLAEQVMKQYYPEWYERYPECGRGYYYLTSSSAMRWSREVLADEEGLTEMSAEEVIAVLFEQRELEE